MSSRKHAVESGVYRVRIVLFFVFYLALARTVQLSAGALTAGFGSFPDESAHYMGGLMIHDYLADAFGSNPIAYAREFYARLPILGIGVWGPLYYAIEAVWIALVGAGRSQVLWLNTLFGAFFGLGVYLAVRRRGEWLAAACGMLVLLVPCVQRVDCAVMMDMAISALAIFAVLAFARYLTEPALKWSIAFGLLSACAILMKNSSIYLAFLPPLAILFSGRWRIVSQPSFWAAPLVVAALCLPWLYISWPVMLLGLASAPAPSIFQYTLEYLTTCANQMGFLIFPTIGGVVLTLVMRGRAHALSLCSVAILVATWAGVILGRVPLQARYLILTYAVCLVLSADCVSWLLDKIPVTSAARRWILIPILILLGVAYGVPHWMRFEHPPEDLMLSWITVVQSRCGSGPCTVLVPTAAEGPSIAEFAQTQPDRRKLTLLRPTKVLSREDWNGGSYQLKVKNKDQMNAFFNRVPVRFVVLQGQRQRRPHDILLADYLRSLPQQWQLRYSSGSGPNTYTVYENVKRPPDADHLVRQAMLRQLSSLYTLN